MNLVDSSGWLEYFGKGTLAEVYTPVIQNTDDLIVPTIIIYEVIKKVMLQRGEEEALKAAGLMSLGNVVDLTQEISMAAAALSIEHKLPMADSIILATAYNADATLWTQDEHFSGLEGVEFIEMGRGASPSPQA